MVYFEANWKNELNKLGWFIQSVLKTEIRKNRKMESKKDKETEEYTAAWDYLVF